MICFFSEYVGEQIKYNVSKNKNADSFVVMWNFKTTWNRQKSCNEKKKNNIIFEFD
jgi:metal-sulfur cluster biosynthetic enzyme